MSYFGASSLIEALSFGADALSFGAATASLYRGEKLHRQSLEHDKELHVREVASSTEQHFQELCAELLTAAKEADRDVWEQRNGQFNNLMLSATLMFGVAVATIVEGNFNQHVDERTTAVFCTFVALALSSLFVCLTCCMLVSRRMNIYMIKRSLRFVDRLGNIIKTADKIYTDAADAADRITDGAGDERARNGRGAGKVARVDVREELRRMRAGRTSFQRELMRGLESTAGGMKAVELQASSPAEPRLSPVLEASSPVRAPPATTGGARSADGGGAGVPRPPQIVLPPPGVQSRCSGPSRRPSQRSVDGGARRRGIGGGQSSASAEGLDSPSSVRALADTLSFDEFWQRHCARIGALASRSFIAGTTCVWGAMITFMFDTYYSSHLAVPIFMSICGFSLLFTLVLTAWVLYNDQYIIEHDLTDATGGRDDRRIRTFSALHLAREKSMRRQMGNSASSMH